MTKDDDEEEGEEKGVEKEKNAIIATAFYTLN